MDYLKALIVLLKSLFGLGSKIATNRGLRTPFQEPAIRSEAIKDAFKDYNTISKTKQKKLIKTWKNRLKVLGLRSLKRGNKIEQLIHSGGIINSIEPHNKGIVINYTFKDVASNVVV